MAELLKEEAPDHRAVGHELARRSGVNLARARPAAVRLWHAHGRLPCASGTRAGWR